MSASSVREKKVFGSLKYEEWPQIDRDLMQAATAPKTFLRPGGPASSWRQTTCETVLYRYGVFLWWLRESERLSPSSAPVARATPETIADFVQEYGAGHASTSLAATLHGVYEAIRVMHPEADLSYLRDTVGALKANAKPRAKLCRAWPTIGR